MSDKPRNELSIMDSAFHRNRFKKTLMGSLSNLAANALWIELDEQERKDFIKTWKDFSRNHSATSDTTLHQMLDFDSLMEGAVEDWIREMERKA